MAIKRFGTAALFLILCACTENISGKGGKIQPLEPLKPSATLPALDENDVAAQQVVSPAPAQPAQAQPAAQETIVPATPSATLQAAQPQPGPTQTTIVPAPQPVSLQTAVSPQPAVITIPATQPVTPEAIVSTHPVAPKQPIIQPIDPQKSTLPAETTIPVQLGGAANAGPKTVVPDAVKRQAEQIEAGNRAAQTAAKLVSGPIYNLFKNLRLFLDLTDRELSGKTLRNDVTKKIDSLRDDLTRSGLPFWNSTLSYKKYLDSKNELNPSQTYRTTIVFPIVKATNKIGGAAFATAKKELNFEDWSIIGLSYSFSNFEYTNKFAPFSGPSDISKKPEERIKTIIYSSGIYPMVKFDLDPTLEEKEEFYSTQFLPNSTQPLPKLKISGKAIVLTVLLPNIEKEDGLEPIDLIFWLPKSDTGLLEFKEQVSLIPQQDLNSLLAGQQPESVPPLNPSFVPHLELFRSIYLSCLSSLTKKLAPPYLLSFDQLQEALGDFDRRTATGIGSDLVRKVAGISNKDKRSKEDLVESLRKSHYTLNNLYRRLLLYQQGLETKSNQALVQAELESLFQKAHEQESKMPDKMSHGRIAFLDFLKSKHSEFTGKQDNPDQFQCLANACTERCLTIPDLKVTFIAPFCPKHWAKYLLDHAGSMDQPKEPDKEKIAKALGTLKVERQEVYDGIFQPQQLKPQNPPQEDSVDYEPFELPIVDALDHLDPMQDSGYIDTRWQNGQPWLDSRT